MKKKMLLQRLCGIVMLLLSVVLWEVAVHGIPGDRDITALFLTVPLGLYILFTKHYIMSF